MRRALSSRRFLIRWTGHDHQVSVSGVGGNPVSTAATRDDLLSVVSALTVSAVEQRRWEQEYRGKAEASFRLANEHDENPLLYAKYRSEQNMFERFAAQAAGTANAFEISADMINKYVEVPE